MHRYHARKQNAVVRIIAAVLHDEHAVMGASTLMTGRYGEQGIFTSLPRIIGRNGIEHVMELDLSQAELEAFHASCQHIRDDVDASPGGRTQRTGPACRGALTSRPRLLFTMLLAKSKTLAMQYRPKRNVDQPAIVPI